MTVTKTLTLEDEIKQLALDKGAVLVGICSAESLIDKDREFSDPNYLLPGAQSVICVAINLSDDVVYKWLSKEDRVDYWEHDDDVQRKLMKIAETIKSFLEEKGYRANNNMVNFDYKYHRNQLGKMGLELLEEYLILKDKEKDPNYQLSAKELKKLKRTQKNISRNSDANFNKRLTPEFSNKMAAIASGLGRLGWSGLVMTEKYGARVFFNTVITDAKLKPDKPLEKNPCDKCKICVKTCQASYFLEDEEQKITIAGIEEVMGRHRKVAYCETLCGGLIGKVGDTEWSTWIPYRLKEGESLPGEDLIDEYVANMVREAFLEGGQTAKHLFNLERIVIRGYDAKPKDQHIPSCSFCMAVCGPTLEDRKKSFELLKNSGSIEIGDFEHYYGTSEF